MAFSRLASLNCSALAHAAGPTSLKFELSPRIQDQAKLLVELSQRSTAQPTDAARLESIRRNETNVRGNGNAVLSSTSFNRWNSYEQLAVDLRIGKDRFINATCGAGRTSEA
jgi:hypothetical protein